MAADPAILALARALGRRAAALPDVVFRVGDAAQPVPTTDWPAVRAARKARAGTVERTQ